jgi:hypothetical protein
MWQLYVGSLFILCIIQKIKSEPKIERKDNDYGHFIYLD